MGVWKGALGCCESDDLKRLDDYKMEFDLSFIESSSSITAWLSILKPETRLSNHGIPASVDVRQDSIRMIPEFIIHPPRKRGRTATVSLLRPSWEGADLLRHCIPSANRARVALREIRHRHVVIR